jgi:hypothetical protein
MRLLTPLLILAFTAHAEVIDRIAVTIGQTVITETEVLHEIRLTALLNGEEPDVSGSNKLDTADRLIEQQLIRREMELSRISVDPEKGAAERYQELRQRFPSEQAYYDKLREYNLTDQDVRDALKWQSSLLQFIELRFAPAIQVGEDEIRDYYEREVKPLAAARNQPVSYEQARSDIEAILTSQRVDNALDRWIGQVRTQMNIQYKQEVFR